MNDNLSWCRRLLVPILFHDVASLHPLSFHIIKNKSSVLQKWLERNQYILGTSKLSILSSNLAETFYDMCH